MTTPKDGVGAAPTEQRQVREDSQGLGVPGRLSPSHGVKACRSPGRECEWPSLCEGRQCQYVPPAHGVEASALLPAPTYTHEQVRSMLDDISTDARRFGLDVVDHLNGHIGLRQRADGVGGTDGR